MSTDTMHAHMNTSPVGWEVRKRLRSTSMSMDEYCISFPVWSCIVGCTAHTHTHNQMNTFPHKPSRCPPGFMV